MNLEKTMKNLKLRGYTVTYFETGAEAANYMSANISGTSVGIGGCKTAEQMGLFERLSENNSVYWHWKNPGKETIAKANSASVFISGVNAMTEGGEILNIDGNGNRLAGQVYGNDKLYLVTSVKKICPDFESALYRARNTAAIENGKRFDIKTPCKIDGKCHDCRSADRICNALLVLWGPMQHTDTEIVLIGEELGM